VYLSLVPHSFSLTVGQAWSGTDAGYFPSIRDAIEEGNWELAQKEIQKVANIIEKASRKLLDETTPT
jgi:hypothetical protein